MTQSATGQKVFGSGYFYAIPNVTNPNPTSFGATQSVSCDFKRDLKYLHGTNQLPIESASGKTTVSGKSEMATVNGRLINDLLLGGSMAAGENQIVRGEVHAIPGTGPFTITIAPPGSGTFGKNLGVKYVATNVPLVQVASAPATGQYSVTGAVFTFAAADDGLSVSFDYSYSITTAGQTVTMTNQPMGKTGNFTSVIALNFGTDQNLIQLNNCMSGGWSLSTKLDDFAMPSFEYGAATDDTDTLGTMSFAQVN